MLREVCENDLVVWVGGLDGDLVSVFMFMTRIHAATQKAQRLTFERPSSLSCGIKKKYF